MSESPGFQIDRAGVRELHQSREAGQASMQGAEAIRSAGEAISPVDTGEYRGSFVARQEMVATLSRLGGNYKRAGAVVENTAPHAGAVESQHQVLTRALGQARI